MWIKNERVYFEGRYKTFQGMILQGAFVDIKALEIEIEKLKEDFGWSLSKVNKGVYYLYSEDNVLEYIYFGISQNLIITYDAEFSSYHWRCL